MELVVTDGDIVEQAKGFLRGSLNVSLEDALGLLDRYAHTRIPTDRIIAQPNDRTSHPPHHLGGHEGLDRRSLIALAAGRPVGNCAQASRRGELQWWNTTKHEVIA